MTEPRGLSIRQLEQILLSTLVANLALLKVSKAQKQIVKFSFEPKIEGK